MYLLLYLSLEEGLHCLISYLTEKSVAGHLTLALAPALALTTVLALPLY